jgi:hypothetical protein
MIGSGFQSIAYDFQAGKNRDPSPCFFRGIKQNSEDAIDPSEMKRKFASRFIFNRERYLGNAAYSPVLNSMIFRVPLNRSCFLSRLSARFSANYLKPVQIKLQLRQQYAG